METVYFNAFKVFPNTIHDYTDEQLSERYDYYNKRDNLYTKLMFIFDISTFISVLVSIILAIIIKDIPLFCCIPSTLFFVLALVFHTLDEQCEDIKGIYASVMNARKRSNEKKMENVIDTEDDTSVWD